MNAPEAKQRLAKRLVDSTNIGSKRDKALSAVMARGGKSQSNEELRGRLKPIYKSVERHAEKEIKKGGKHAVANIKGKNNYMIHLTDRARRRGEED